MADTLVNAKLITRQVSALSRREFTVHGAPVVREVAESRWVEIGAVVAKMRVAQWSGLV